MSAMTKGERNDLQRLVRQRAKVEKAAAAQRKAEILADFERQLATIYTPDDDAAFRELHDFADAALKDADRRLGERCKELGIPDRFRPRINLHWYGRGENGLKDRRAELRKVAVTRLDAMEKAAKTEIERASVEAQTQLVAGGLTTDAAKGFLDALPAVGDLMSTLDVGEVQSLLRNGK